MTDERAASLRLATTHLVNKIREGVSRRFMVYGFVCKNPSVDAGTSRIGGASTMSSHRSRSLVTAASEAERERVFRA